MMKSVSTSPTKVSKQQSKKPSKDSPPKKPTMTKPYRTHPSYSVMIRRAIKSLEDPKGSSRQAILKQILSANDVGPDPKSVNSHLKTALLRGVEKGSLTHLKGAGATGRFRIKAKKIKRAKKPKSPPSEAANSKPEKTSVVPETKQTRKTKASEEKSALEKPKLQKMPMKNGESKKAKKMAKA